MKLKSVKPYLLLALSATLLFGCGNKNDKSMQMPAMPVSVIKVTLRDVPVFTEYVGQTAGYREIEVRPRVGGILLKRNYVEGQAVKKGDLLFQIDPNPYQVALEQAQASLQVQQAGLIRAQQDYQRVIPLFKANAVSQKDRDDAVAAYESAKASVAMARAQLKDARIKLGYTRVTAPIGGITSKETYSEGSLLTMNGNPLTKITQLDPLYINFSVSDNDSQEMRKQVAAGKLSLPANMRFDVRVMLSDGTALAQLGQMSFTDSIVDTTTGSVRARAEVANPNSALLPGQFVRVRLEGAKLINAVIIPDKAVLTTQQGKLVWLVGAQDKATPAVVELGQTIGDQVVVTKGLKAGDRVVVDNLLKVRPGALLKPQPVKLAATMINPLAKPQN